MAKDTAGDVVIPDNSHEQEKSIKLHPLAIVGISDHHTRVAVGGSHMDKDAPVVGLLFGHHEGLEISILDAQEMEFSFAVATTSFGGGSQEEQKDHRASLETKIELHKQVFKHHEVVGWYHVHPQDDAVTTDDSAVHMSGMIREYIHESCANPLFLWMHPDPPKSSNSNTQSEFPIRIYESVTVPDGPTRRTKFLPLEFEVDTGEPERIAVEKAFSDQPTSGAHNGLDLQIQSLESCIQSMVSRLEVLLRYVESVKDSPTPKMLRTMRQIDSILSQLPVMLSQRPNEESPFATGYNDVLTISYLAAVNKSTNTLRKLADKIRTVQDSSSKSSGTNKQMAQLSGTMPASTSMAGVRSRGGGTRH